MDRHRTWPSAAGSGGCAKSSVSGMSVARFSRVIQSLRAVLTSDADSSLISARSETTETRCSGRRPVMLPVLAWVSASRRCPSARSSWSWAIRCRCPASTPCSAMSGEAGRSHAGSAGVCGRMCAIPRLVSADTSAGSPRNAAAWSFRQPLLARSRSYASMTSCSTSPRNRCSMLAGTARPATTTRPPRLARTPSMCGTGQRKPGTGRRIRGHPCLAGPEHW